MASHSSTLAWKIPWMEEPGGLQSMGSLRVGHDSMTSLSLFTFMHWKRKWHPLQCSCLENPRDGGAWWAAIYGVAQSQARLKWISSSSSSKYLQRKKSGRLYAKILIVIITTDLNFLLYRQIIYIFIINIFASRKIIKKCFCFVLFFIKMGTQNWAIWGNVSLSMWCKVKISIQDSFFFYTKSTCVILQYLN